MGIYGKYTTFVKVFSFIQMSVAILMISLGIAFRLLVCSWITDASFGFWVGFLVLIGGIIGYCSSRSDSYSYVGYYLCFNTFSIMFAFLVIFCHFLASVHFTHQIDSWNVTSVNHTNSSYNATTGTPMTTTPIKRTKRQLGTTPKPTPTNTTSNGSHSSSSSSSSNSTSPSSTTSAPSGPGADRGPRGPRCYTHQTWSDYVNGVRGLYLVLGMISLCFIEVVVSMFSMMCCWAATKLQPSEISRKKARIQGTVSEIVASENFRNVVARRRHGSNVRSTSLNVSDNRYFIPEESMTTNDTVQDVKYETPRTSVTNQSPDEPTSWYLTTTI